MASFPCSDDPREIIDAVVGAGENAEKFDRFVNGGIYEEVQLGEGEATPTLRNLSHLVKSAASTLDGSDVSGKFSDAANGGTELRTLADHFGDIVNVMDFGAAGDGITDDTDALNNALAAAERKTLFLPAGVYITCTGLRIPSNTRVVGAGMDQTTVKLCDSADYSCDCITNAENWWNHPASITRYGAFTQEMQEANQGNENITVEALTADGNCSRTSTATGHSGSAVHFANVRHLRMRNVRGINGRLHGIDISSAMYTMDYNESGFGTSTVDVVKGPWYVGNSYDVILENCEGIDPQNDDCITTHYSGHIKIINCKAYRNLTTEQVAALGQSHGIEIDDGSYNVYIYGGLVENNNEGVQVKGHVKAYPAHDIFIEGVTSRNNRKNFYVTHGGNIEDQIHARNVHFLNCTSYQTATSYTDPTYDEDTPEPEISGTHLLLGHYDGITVKNMNCIGDGTHKVSNAVLLTQACRNVVIDGLSFRDMPVAYSETVSGRSYGTLIRVNGSAGDNIKFKNIVASNCSNGYVFRTTLTAHGIVVDGIQARRDVEDEDDLSSVVFVSQGTAKHPNTVIKNIRASSGYAETYTEGTASDFAFSEENNPSIIGEAETLWKRSVSNGSANPPVDPANSYALNVGWYAESQDVLENERILIGFKNKVRGEDEEHIGYVGSNHDSSGDVTGNYGLIFGTSDGYDLQDRWEIRYDGRLIPCADEAYNIGYASGKRPLSIFAHNVYSDSGTIGTSDETCKSNIVQIPDAVLDAWADVQWVQFQFNDSIEKKGENARFHAGAVAQRIKAVFEAHGLDAHRYGLICLETWTAEESSNGTAGSQYGLRYNECLAIEAAYQRRKVRQLEERLQAVEARLEAVEAQE